MTQIFFALSYLEANSISDTMCVPCALSAWIIGAVSGIPGLFTTSSALSIRFSLCPPSSNGMFHSRRVDAYSSFIVPQSDRNTSNPLTFASTAAPTPLSAPPRTTILALLISFVIMCDYLIFNKASVLTASIIPTIQNLVTIRGSGIPCFW